MSPQLCDLLTFLLDPSNATSPDEDRCKQAFRAFIQAHDIELCNYGVFEVAAGSPQIDSFTDTNMTSAWIEEYLDRGFDARDYVLRQATLLTPLEPVRAMQFGQWLVPHLVGEDRASAPVLRGAADAGLEDAFAVVGNSPLVPGDPNERFFGIAFGGGRGTGKLAAERQRELMVGAFALFDRLRPHHSRRAFGIQDRLTPRERDVLGAYARGLRRDRVAHELGVALVTVDLHTRNLRRKLRAQTIAEAVARGYAFGFL